MPHNYIWLGLIYTLKLPIVYQSDTGWLPTAVVIPIDNQSDTGWLPTYWELHIALGI